MAKKKYKYKTEHVITYEAVGWIAFFMVLMIGCAAGVYFLGDYLFDLDCCDNGLDENCSVPTFIGIVFLWLAEGVLVIVTLVCLVGILVEIGRMPKETEIKIKVEV